MEPVTSDPPRDLSSPRAGQETPEAEAEASLSLCHNDVAPAPPRDPFNISFLIFFCLGAGLLFPWNAFITAADYFAALYPGSHIESIFPVAYMIPELLTLIGLLLFAKRDTSEARIAYGLATYLVLILVVPTLDLSSVHDGKGSSFSFFVTIFAVAISGVIDAIVQGSLFGMAGELSERYVQALVVGTSASGVIVSFLRIATKACLPQNLQGLRTSANIYFGASMLFLAISLTAFKYLPSLQIIQYLQKQQKQKIEEQSLHLSTSPSQKLLQSSSEIGASSRDRPGSAGGGATSQASLHRSRSSFFRNAWNALGHYENVLEEGESTTSTVEQIEQVFLKIWRPALSVTAIYVVTLSIFPGLFSELKSDSLGDWYPVLLITLYNVGDLFGKMTPSVWQISDINVLVTGVLLRFLFVPIYGFFLKGPAYLHSESMTSFLAIFFGYTNGCLTSWLMMLAPSLVRAEEVDMAGVIMVFFLSFGLFSGSWAALLWIVF